jgi:hypothetical protein
LYGDADIDHTVDAELVRSFDPTKVRNAQRVVELVRLGYIRGDVLDPTCGIARGMWSDYRPESLVCCDSNPAVGPDVVADFRAMPFPDESFDTILFDPPYKANKGDSRGASGGRTVSEQYGLTPDLTEDDIDDLFTDGINELGRLLRPGGHMIVKCQDSMAQDAYWCQTWRVMTLGVALGLDIRDQLHVTNSTWQPVRVQRSARHNYSTMVVLKKPRRRR